MWVYLQSFTDKSFTNADIHKHTQKKLMKQEAVIIRATLVGIY